MLSGVLLILFGCGKPGPSVVYSNVRVGLGSVCARRASGLLECWGKYSEDGPTDSVSEFDNEFGHACAVLESGEGVCWGSTDDDGVGFLEPPDDEPVSVATSWHSTCWLLSSGSVSCAGDNLRGESIEPPSGAYQQVTGGNAHWCALDSGGVVNCWGETAEVDLASLPAWTFEFVDAAEDQICGISVEGNAICVGGDLRGEGTYDLDPWYPETSLATISAGGSFCGLDESGDATCRFSYGCDIPEGPYTSISSYRDMTCGALAEGGIICWGYDAASTDSSTCELGTPADLMTTE